MRARSAAAAEQRARAASCMAGIGSAASDSRAIAVHPADTGRTHLDPGDLRPGQALRLGERARELELASSPSCS